MKILLHCCCAPCLIHPLMILKNRGDAVTPFFYNPNIHPFLEFKRRFDTLKSFADDNKLTIISETRYGLNEFLLKAFYSGTNRCHTCYQMRLERTAENAKSLGFDAFSTTLLYSKYQKHSVIRSICESLALQHGIEFFYNDFREGWQFGVAQSRDLGLYRQPYCGCIFSEQERYDKSVKQQLTQNIE